MSTATEWLLKAFNIPTKKQENDRIIRIGNVRQVLELKQQEYIDGIEERQKRAAIYTRKGHRKLGRNELMIATVYAKNLDMVSDMIRKLELAIAGIEKARLMKTMGAAYKDTIAWLKTSIKTLNNEDPVDQTMELDELMQDIDRKAGLYTKAMDMSIPTDLTKDEERAIEDQLDDFAEPVESTYLAAEENDDNDIYHDITPPIQLKRNTQSSLLLAEDD